MRNRIVRTATVLFVAALVLAPQAGGAEEIPPGFAHVEFTQLNWLADDGTELVPFTRIVEAEFGFEPTETQLLAENGGGYVNVVTELGGELQWSVENLYLSYPDPAYLADSHPSVHFGADTLNGTPLTEVFWTLAVTAGPLETPPELVHTIPFPVGHADYLVGGIYGGGSGSTDIYNTMGAFVGCHVPDCGSAVVLAMLPGPSSSVAAIDEGKMACGPAAVARSLKSMFGTELADTPAQDVYDDLYKRMKTNPTSGTKSSSLKSGKNKYAKVNDLPVRTNKYNFKNGVRFGPDALSGGGDVELRVVFPGGQGHFAMVTSITSLGDGKGYQITYVDDPTQGDGKAENKEHTITVDERGRITSGGGGVVTDFFVEVKKKK